MILCNAEFRAWKEEIALFCSVCAARSVTQGWGRWRFTFCGFSVPTRMNNYYFCVQIGGTAGRKCSMTGRQLIELLSAVKCRMKVAFAGQGMHQAGQEIIMINKGGSRKLLHRDERRHPSRALPPNGPASRYVMQQLMFRACHMHLFPG